MLAPTMPPRVTVIVLTHQRCAELRRTLEHLQQLPERPPLIVVDNASTDGSSDMVKRVYPACTVLRSASNLGAAARNLGARYARTPYIAFSDDDTWWEPGALTEAVQLLDRHPHVGALTARVLVGASRREDPACQSMQHSPLPAPVSQPGPSVLGLLAGAAVFRRAAFLQAGGYHPRLFIGGEEALLTLDLAAAGWTLMYAPQLTVCHYPSVRRDTTRRRALLARNALWTAWLRLPCTAALRETVRLTPRVWREAGGLRGYCEALAGWRWIRRERRVVPPHVVRMWRTVERARRPVRSRGPIKVSGQASDGT